MNTQDIENIPTNLSANEHFQDVVNRVALSRRKVIKSGLGLSAAMFLGGSLTACGSDNDSPAATGGNPAPTPDSTGVISFSPIAASSGDSVLVPAGYQAQILAPWGSALFNDSPAWKGDASETGDDQARQVGDNHDGMHFFAIPGADSSTEGLLVMNHEYCNYEYLFKPDNYGDDPTATWTLDKVRKAQHAHGASVLHVRTNSAGKWEVVIGSYYNRRITGRTPMELTGPAAGNILVKTVADATGTRVFGTLNNCGKASRHGAPISPAKKTSTVISAPLQVWIPATRT